MILDKEAEYGYGLSKKMDQYGLKEIPKGTIYPLLATMEKRGLIMGKDQPSEIGPTRKYYYVTESGLQAKAAFIKEWQSLQKSVDRLVEEELNE